MFGLCTHLHSLHSCSFLSRLFFLQGFGHHVLPSKLIKTLGSTSASLLAMVHEKRVHKHSEGYDDEAYWHDSRPHCSE